MWSIYSTDRGIAVRSTFNRLRDSIKESHVGFSEISYLPPDDYHKRCVFSQSQLDSEERSAFSLGLIKRDCFAYETELRAFVASSENTLGTYVDIEPKQLIESIWISPKAPKWLHEVISQVARDYDLGNDIVFQSTLFNSLSTLNVLAFEDAVKPGTP